MTLLAEKLFNVYLSGMSSYDDTVGGWTAVAVYVQKLTEACPCGAWEPEDALQAVYTDGVDLAASKYPEPLATPPDVRTDHVDA